MIVYTIKLLTLYIVLFSSFIMLPLNQQKVITVIGTGYVGLVSGACLADIGNLVICADIDAVKINNLKQGIVPIYEQGLNEIIARNVESGRLSFTYDIKKAINSADIIFIAVGTPESPDGSADLSYVFDVVKNIALNFNSEKIIVTKSTVPIGTGKKIRTLLESEYGINPNSFSIVSNPEFLREGFAVNDFLSPDRIVIGTDSSDALIALCEVYGSLIATGAPYVLTDIQTAEMIKYASNAFLSVKISYINEIANICDAVGADIKTVAYAMGLDDRISPKFLQPGPGFGGYCFPKDAQAIVHIAQQNNVPLYTVQAALDANKVQQTKPVEKLIKLMERTNQIVQGKSIQILQGKIIAVLGLAFKANTDDVRYSPSIKTIELLKQHGAIIRAYDPIATENMSKLFPDINYCKTPYKAATGADAVIIMTDWDEIKQIDFAKIKALVNQPIIVDARNIINPEILKQLGFACDTIGQSALCEKRNTPHQRALMLIHRYMPLVPMNR